MLMIKRQKGALIGEVTKSDGRRSKDVDSFPDYASKSHQWSYEEEVVTVKDQIMA